MHQSQEKLATESMIGFEEQVWKNPNCSLKEESENTWTSSTGLWVYNNNDLFIILTCLKLTELL